MEARESGLINEFGERDSWTEEELAHLLCGLTPPTSARWSLETETSVDQSKVEAAHSAIESAVTAAKLTPIKGGVAIGTRALHRGHAISFAVSQAIEWAANKRLSFPTFPKFPAIRSDGGRWPWGKYETPLLRALADAAAQFWSTYDPSEPATAPKRAEVIDWLTGPPHKLSHNQAESIALVLRDSELRPGPRS